jgi:hypothetical protein
MPITNYIVTNDEMVLDEGDEQQWHGKSDFNQPASIAQVTSTKYKMKGKSAIGGIKLCC